VRAALPAGYSAEEISTPHQFQPYGDLFSINMDGTNLQRLTHGQQPLNLCSYCAVPAIDGLLV
jgi:hypothetical protein